MNMCVHIDNGIAPIKDEGTGSMCTECALLIHMAQYDYDKHVKATVSDNAVSTLYMMVDEVVLGTGKPGRKPGCKSKRSKQQMRVKGRAKLVA